MDHTVSAAGNITIQSSSSGSINLSSTSSISASNGHGVQIYVGSSPTTPTTITTQANVTLLGSAVNGSNVFYGSGINAGLPNPTIDIESGGQVIFSGPNITLQGGAEIKS